MTAPTADRSRLSPQTWVLVIILIGTLVRLGLAGWMGLGYGESYYFSAALRPALSYFDHPALTFWLGWLSLESFGPGPVGLRLSAILFFAGTTWLMFTIGRRLYSDRAGLLAALLLNLSAVFTLATGVFFQPDAPLMFFWLLSLHHLVRLMFEPELKNPVRHWLLTGLWLGLAMLSKYHAVFIPAGVLAFILTRSENRRWLAHPGPYLAVLLAILISSPVLIWNAQHDWISFLWQGARGADSAGFRPDWLARNIGGQAALLLPWIWVPLVWELLALIKTGPRRPRRWFGACLALGPILVFTAVAAYASIGYHFHWQAPGYLILFLYLGRRVEKALAAGSRRWARWLKLSVWFTAVALAFVSAHAATGFANPIFIALAPEKHAWQADPAHEMVDWTGLREALEKHGLADKKDLFGFSSRWYFSGKMDYALRGSLPVLCFNNDPRSFAFYYRMEDFLGRDGLFVAAEPQVYNPPQDFGIYFDKIELLDTVLVKRHGKTLKTLRLYYCTNFRKPFPLPY